MNTTSMRIRRGIALGAIVAAAGVSGACADKGFTPPLSRLSPVIALQVTTFADQQQAAFGPRYIVVAAGFDGDSGADNGALLAMRVLPFAAGTQRVTLPVDISRCLAYAASRGRSACPLLVGAVIVSDTSAFADTASGDIFDDAFDEFVVGPFDVVPGRVPTIPAIDLSASRYGVVKWEGDEALRLGGNDAPYPITGAPTGVPQGAGDAAIIVPTQGYLFPSGFNQSPQGPYPQIAVLSGGQWRRFTATLASVNTGGFTGVAAFAVNDVYAAHRAGLFRFDGATFGRVNNITDSLFSVAAATAAGTKYVIAGGGAGVVWIGNTQTWTRYTVGTTQRIDGVCITGPSEAFASSTGGGIWRFDGATWTSAPAPSTTSKFGLQCPAPGQAFILSQGTAGGLFRWTGTSWTGVSTSGLTSARLVTWGVVSANEMYAWGDSALVDRAFYRFNGTSWTEVGRKRFTQSAGIIPGVMWADPRGGAAYLASPFGRVERVTPTGVTVTSYQPALRDAIVTSPSSAFVVGWNLFLARWDGARWVVDPPPSGTPTIRILQGVWSDGPSSAWAVGNSNTILRWNGTAWSIVSDALKPIATSDSYNAVWGAGGSVWVVGDNTMLKCAPPATCTPEASGTGALYSIWGTPDGATKFAVGAGGRIIRSLNGGAWQPMASPTSRALARVAGSGPNDVWAVGDSVLIHFDGAQWVNVPLTGDLQYFRSRVPSPLQGLFQLGLWARGPKEVYLGGETGGIARWNGTDWSEMRPAQFRRRILAITGLPGGCGLIVTDGQSDQPSPTLWRGVGPSGCFLSPMTGPATWP